MFTTKPRTEVTNKNYCAVIVEVKTLRKHSNADRLQCTTIFGNNLICGLDVQVGQRMLYFPLESQLSVEFAQKNDLLKRKDAEGKQVGGMFEENRRVKCLKLRGEKSEGFICGVEALAYLLPDPSSLDLGTEFNSIDGKAICEKYVIPFQGRPSSAKKGRQGDTKHHSRLVPNQFRFHTETEQLLRNAWKVKPNHLVSITLKIHGTSWVVSRCLVLRKLKWWERLLQRVGVQLQDKEYDNLYSSRRVIQNDNPTGGFYSGSTNLYTHIGKRFDGLLHDGETVYGEAVGFTPDGQAIQKGYDYGCEPNKYKLAVYRITKTGSDGRVHEYSWHQVVQRCAQIGMEPVTTLFYGKATGISDFTGDVIVYANEEEFGQRFAELVKAYVERMGMARDCKNKVPEEGVVVRIEGLEVEALKCKQFAFLEAETKGLDKGETSMEEAV